MRYLVRVSQANRDKQNTEVDTLEKALKILGREEEEISNKLNWLHCTDYFFSGTNDYIRENKN